MDKYRVHATTWGAGLTSYTTTVDVWAKDEKSARERGLSEILRDARFSAVEVTKVVKI